MNNDFRERTQFLGKWIGVLFWLTIPKIIAAVMTMDFVKTLSPTIGTGGNILQVLCMLIYISVLLRLTHENIHYRDAGLFGLIGAVFTGISKLMISGGTVFSSGSIVVGIIALICGFAAEYQEYTAHAEILKTVACDRKLAEKWRKLWTKYIIFTLGMGGSVLLLALVPVVGVIVIIICSIVVVVLSILKIVYLYQTSKLFKTIEEPFPAVEEDSEKAKGDSVEILLDPRIEAQVKAEEFMEDAETVVDADVVVEEDDKD